jgi:hypothetical protein
VAPDWSGFDGVPTAERYRSMAQREVHGISPSYEVLCAAIADDAEVLARLDTLPEPKRQPNLLLATVRFLGGQVDAWPAFRAFVLERWAEVATLMRARRTQTNEPTRCATLLPVLAALPQPLALLEVGTAAGLCLYPDRYAYRYAVGGHEVGLGDSPAVLRCAVVGPAPLPGALPQVAWRAGLDLNPLDVRSEPDMQWLAALVWPEQVERAATLRAAIDVVRADPPCIVAGNLLTDLSALAADAPPDTTLVVFHSAVLAYLGTDERIEFAAQVRALARTRPLCWLSNEAPRVVAGTDVDTGGRARFVLARDGHPLALTGPHGATLDWW